MNSASPSRVITDRAERVPSPVDLSAAPAEPARPRRRWWIVAVLAVALGLGAYAYLSRQAPPTTEPATATTPAVTRTVQLLPSEVTTVAPAVLREQVSITGSLAPIRQSTLSFQSGGLIEDVAVKTGQRVTAGDVIATLDTADFTTKIQQQEGAIAATEAQLALARKQLASTQTLADRGVSSRAALDSAQAAVNAQEANLAAQQAGLESIRLTFNHTTITAPFDGYVSDRSVEPGQTVGAGAAVVTIVDLSEVEFQASAPVNAAASLRVGQAAAVTIEGLPGETLAGEISRISPVAATGTRSIPVFVTLENPGDRLRGGMFATGKVTIAENADAIAVPTDAVRTDADGTFVLAIRDGKLTRLPVSPSRTWNGGRLTEVTGLATGEVVVSASLPELQPGAEAAVAAE